jgi:hypothetical protein
VSLQFAPSRNQRVEQVQPLALCGAAIREARLDLALIADPESDLGGHDRAGM